jgi:hypothetical protein
MGSGWPTTPAWSGWDHPGRDQGPLALAEGATENATVVTEVLVGLRDRGLEVTRPILVVIDGAEALGRAVTEVFDHPVIQRLKLRNVSDRLPDAVASTVAKRMRGADRHADSLIAQAELEALARELDRSPRARPRACGRAGRDPHHRPAWCAADTGSNGAVHELDLVFSLARRIARPERDLAGHRWLRPDSEFDWSSARMPSNSRCRARLPGTRRRAAWLERSLGPQPRSAGPRPPRVATGSGSPDDRRLACSNQTEWRGSTRTSRCLASRSWMDGVGDGRWSRLPPHRKGLPMLSPCWTASSSRLGGSGWKVSAGLGRHVTQALITAGYDVREVQANRTAERRRRRRRHKTDREDAEAIARETLADPDLPPAGKQRRPDPAWEELVAVRNRRKSLIGQRVRLLNEAERC